MVNGPPSPQSSALQPAPDCTLVIFGAGGDLTKRLLMPALYNLATSNALGEEFRVLGVDRLDSTSGEWAATLSETMRVFSRDPSGEFHPKSIDAETWRWIGERLTYLSGDFLKVDLYEALRRQIKGAAIFYLAVAPRFFGLIVDGLAKGGLLTEDGDGFRRVVIEKPFGRDLATARALNQQLLRSADENQIYRVDHFLGKETVQGILALRFANTLYEPIWCRDFVDHVQITAAETLGVEQRGAYYEGAGALRDMVPNHLFQLLCMTAMEAPASLQADAVRTAKTRLLQAVRPVLPQDAAHGQYVSGEVNGHPAKAYRKETGVAPDSSVETYAAIKLVIENERWAGVPFYLRSGKRLAARRTEIAIRLKAPRSALFCGGEAPANLIRIEIDPEHDIVTEFNAKAPGPRMELGPATSTFRYRDSFPERPTVGYETLLYDCMLGDATLFQRADTIDAGWAIVDPLLEAWPYGAIEPYATGCSGPITADVLLRRDGREWLPLIRT